MSRRSFYTCGAKTQKGLPCSRNVYRRGERCHQHRGAPSIAVSGAPGARRVQPTATTPSNSPTSRSNPHWSANLSDGCWGCLVFSGFGAVSLILAGLLWWLIPGPTSDSQASGAHGQPIPASGGYYGSGSGYGSGSRGNDGDAGGYGDSGGAGGGYQYDSSTNGGYGGGVAGGPVGVPAAPAPLLTDSYVPADSPSAPSPLPSTASVSPMPVPSPPVLDSTTVVVEFFQAVRDDDYVKAWTLWDGSRSASHLTVEYQGTISDRLLTSSSNEVDVLIAQVQPDGSTAWFQMTYEVHAGQIYSETRLSISDVAAHRLLHVKAE